MNFFTEASIKLKIYIIAYLVSVILAFVIPELFKSLFVLIAAGFFVAIFNQSLYE